MANPKEKTPIQKPFRGCLYWLRLVGFGVTAFILIFFPAWEYAYIDAATKPAPSILCCKTPRDYGLDFQTVSVPSPDGFSLAGWYVPTRNGAAIVFLHGYDANRTEMLERAMGLASQGFGVLLYDLRGHGESGGAFRAMGWPDTRDLQAALDFLQQQPGVDQQRMGALGFSVGGQVVIRTAAMDDRIRAVMVDDPAFARIEDIPPMPSFFDDFEARGVTRLDLYLISQRTGIKLKEGVAEAISKISPRPILYVASGQMEMSRTLSNHLFALASEPKELWEIPEAGHGGTFAARPVEYTERMLNFFQKYLGPPP